MASRHKDPDFFKAIGKVKGWNGKEDYYLTVAMDATMAYWHRLIDLIHEHGTDEGIKKFCESIIN